MTTWEELGWGEPKQCSVCGWWTRGAPDQDLPDPCGYCWDNLEMSERMRREAKVRESQPAEAGPLSRSTGPLAGET